jgi:hypothetical protein
MHGPQETRSIWVLVHQTRLGRTYVLGLVCYKCMITAAQVDAEQESLAQASGPRCTMRLITTPDPPPG